MILPGTGSGTDNGELTPATWVFFSAMQEAIGQRANVRPLRVVSSAESLQRVEQASSVISPEEREAGESRAGRKRKSSEGLLEFMKGYTERQEKRQREADKADEETQRKTSGQMDKRLELFGKMVEKM